MFTEKPPYYLSILILFIFAIFIYQTKTCIADDVEIQKNFFDREKISGDWGGARTTLEDKGISFGLVYKGEIWKLASGNVEHVTTYCDNFDILFNADFEKVFGWNSANLFFHGLGNEGINPATAAGVKQGITNIGVSTNTWKIFELYLEQKLFDNHLALLFGLLDLNSNFDSKILSQLFLNPSHGIGIDWSQSGKNGPSIFPTSSLAFRIRVSPFENTYFQAAVFDGVAGSTDNPKGTQIILGENDGWLVTAKAAYSKGNKSDFLPGNEKYKQMPYSKFAVGFWYYTNHFSRLFSGISNWGFYCLFEQDIYNETSDVTQGLSMNARLGVADDITNQVNYFFAGTFVYTGLLPGRERDQLGIAIASGHNSYLYRTDKMAKGSNIDPFEHDIEFTYKFFLTPAIAIQPDLQYILSPSLLDTKDNLLVFGTRLLLVF